MTIFGVDVHPTYQRGLSIEQVRREGFDWLTVKASQGTNTSWSGGALAWIERGERVGLISFPYHYLTTADVDAQAVSAKKAGGGRPIMVDFEDGSGSVANLRAFLGACSRIGLRVPLAYVPRWYWQKVGQASLAGLPPLVSSRYRTATGSAGAIFGGVPDSWWAGFGGGQVAVLQFSDRATVAGQQIDVNAYRGTREQFAALIGGAVVAPPRPQLPELIDLPLAPGRNTGTVVVPVGSASGVVARAWLSVRAAGGAHAQAWFQVSADSGGPAPGAGLPVDWTLQSARRGVVEIPSGTEYIEYDIDAHGAGALCVEMLPK